MKKLQDSRHEARKIALQSLFEWSFNSTEITEIASRNIDDQGHNDDLSSQTEIDKELVFFLVNGIVDNLETLDKIIEEAAPEWPLEQIAKVDLEILRISVFELYIARNVPPKVAIDEAVELGKQFGGENSSKFINGVLGTVVKNLMPGVAGINENKPSKKKGKKSK
jgi:N utilization substance protein B